MKGLDDGPIIRGGKNTVRQIRSNMMEKPRLNFFCLVSDTRGGGYHIVGRVVRLESSGEILEAIKGKVIFDRKHFSFLE